MSSTKLLGVPMSQRMARKAAAIGAAIGTSKLFQLASWKIMHNEMMPQVIMMRAIQMRAPTLSRMRLLGTSKRK